MEKPDGSVWVSSGQSTWRKIDWEVPKLTFQLLIRNLQEDACGQ